MGKGKDRHVTLFPFHRWVSRGLRLKIAGALQAKRVLGEERAQVWWQ